MGNLIRRFLAFCLVCGILLFSFPAKVAVKAAAFGTEEGVTSQIADEAGEANSGEGAGASAATAESGEASGDTSGATNDDTGGTAEAVVALLVDTATSPVGAGESFEISVSLSAVVTGEAVTLSMAYDNTIFLYTGYAPDGYTSVDGIENDAAAGRLLISLSSMGADGFEALGRVSFQARADATLVNGRSTLQADISYVVFTDEAEQNHSMEAFIEIGTRGMKGDTNNDQVVDLIDLSNINSWFVVSSADELWEAARYFDFNGNGEIDIGDIVEVALLISPEL